MKRIIHLIIVLIYTVTYLLSIPFRFVTWVFGKIEKSLEGWGTGAGYALSR